MLKLRQNIQSKSFPKDTFATTIKTNRDLAPGIFGELWVLLLLVVLCVGIFVGQPWVIALVAMSTIVAVVARIWARLSLENFNYSRLVSRDRMFPGDEFELTIVLENQKPLPLPWLHITDEIPEELELLETNTTTVAIEPVREILETFNMAWYERLKRTYRLSAKKRGFCYLGPASVKSGDLFGLFRSEKKIVSKQPIIVLPRIVHLDRFKFPSARPVGDSKSRNTLFEDFNRPRGLREYQEGDSLRSIDWKATARLNKLHVRSYEYSVEHSVTLLVDVQTSELAWGGYNERFLERVVTAGASLANFAVTCGSRLGLVSNAIPLSKSARMVIPPGSDPGRLLTILEALAMARPISLGHLDAVMSKEPKAIPFGTTVVVISSVLPLRLMQAVQRLVIRGHPAIAIYVGDGQYSSHEWNFEVCNMGLNFDGD